MTFDSTGIDKYRLENGKIRLIDVMSDDPERHIDVDADLIVNLEDKA